MNILFMVKKRSFLKHHSINILVRSFNIWQTLDAWVIVPLRLKIRCWVNVIAFYHKRSHRAFNLFWIEARGEASEIRREGEWVAINRRIACTERYRLKSWRKLWR